MAYRIYRLPGPPTPPGSKPTQHKHKNKKYLGPPTPPGSKQTQHKHKNKKYVGPPTPPGSKQTQHKHKNKKYLGPPTPPGSKQTTQKRTAGVYMWIGHMCHNDFFLRRKGFPGTLGTLLVSWQPPLWRIQGPPRKVFYGNPTFVCPRKKTLYTMVQRATWTPY